MKQNEIDNITLFAYILKHNLQIDGEGHEGISAVMEMFYKLIEI